MICDEIKVTCTIQMRRFETLLDAISSNRGDAIIASLAVTPQLRARSISAIPITGRRRGSCRGATP
jgi:ABC-type amino acid transport substrate-binding protein